MGKINIAAAIITDIKGRCLLVRKRGTHYFMQPGGKPEAGELPEAALVRELKEELNFIVSPDELVSVGSFTDVAANEPGHMVCADIFRISTDRTYFEPAAEIEEVIWFESSQFNHIKLAPLTENHLIPLLKRGGFCETR
ncbi:NUDIX domain-containing protein [Pectobacterium parmentieri]|uniref:8-oxo-dGTP diphosphatase n=1 Tax=Pectobacterium parmentieri TaxID=1905730 RepID=A0ABS0S712_PECPM|nr:NUDIX domain-containing protein [Pectobacterium parmentieri]AYH08079.1 NUDIX domain-containing protein [Pectobacterium parmentieri]AYH16832.1 NUDIX domain-containing protein [Pectobacterium parmentieri]AYH25533.1 NUDIX domain-containing protein [Pectobacterium parmentieri]MBI0472904.1 NUDIX domain-containing protein [Pectobacterium parmentieri]MBI0495512.1 NUDIX domain-containing protein [Pectobacterium parmentieri]